MRPMSWKSSSERYGNVAIAIHWVSALAILALFVLGFTAANSDDELRKAALLRAHIPLGILVFALTVLRIVWWWFADRGPAPLAGMPSWQIRSEHFVRILLYVSVLVMGASGIGLLVLSGAGPVLFGGSAEPLPHFWNYPPMRAHFLAAVLLLGLACFHVAAAFYHHLFRRDRLLSRMGIG
jgi:cytochrome b561